MRTTIVALMTLSLSAFAQGPEPGHGSGMRGFDTVHGPGGPGARFLGAEAGMPGRVVKNAPYSADVVTESTHTLADGNHIKQSATSKVYRDSEGRTRREQSVNLGGLARNGNMPQLVFINDPVAGVNYALNATNRTGAKTSRAKSSGANSSGTKSSWNAGAWGGPRPQGADRGPGPRFGYATGPGSTPHGLGRRGSDSNIKTESLGKQTIEGVQAEGSRTTMTIPSGQIGNDLPIQIVTENWYSAELETMVLSRHSDPRNGETVTKLMNVSRAEPSRMLFDVPADFKVTESERGMPRPRTGSPSQAK